LSEESINFNILERNPLMVVISGPSGVGKDAVLRALKRSSLPIYHVVTVNTRPPRLGEKEGVDYFFVSRQKFEEMIEQEAFIEYSHVYEDYKGVPKSQIRKAMASGKDVILRLDVQGAEKIKRLVPNAILIFLVPSSQKDWFKRLGGRHKSDKDMETRINTAREELIRAMDFDYIVTNIQNKLDETVQTIEAILIAEHQKTSQRKIDI
jgi:guanylate kinase